MLTQDQIDSSNGDSETLSMYRTDSNMFGRLVENSELDDSIVNAVLSDLFQRANKNDNDENYVDDNIPIVLNADMHAFAKTKRVNNTVDYIEVNPTKFWMGYDFIILFAHEIGHVIDIYNKTLSNIDATREQSADGFVKKHWAYNRISTHARDIIQQHEKENR